MKKKILFYGNCQVAVMAKYFRLNLSDKFDVQICEDCGLEPFWAESGVFAVWSPKNRDSQEGYKDCIHSKIKESDIFVFQDHGGRSVIKELITKYLHDNVASGLKICLPDTRFFAHLTDAITLHPYIEYIKNIVKEPEEIIKYLQESEDPKLTEILKNEYPFNNKDYLQYRNENRRRYEEEVALYDHRIDMCDYMESEFQKKLLCVSHNHMNESYFIEMLNRLFSIIGIEQLDPIKSIQFPGYASLDPQQFNFFTKIFPNLDYGNFKGKKLVVEDIKKFIS